MRLFGLGRKEPARAEPAIPGGVRVYAIGDVHGRFDLLRILLDRIEADDRARAPAETHVVLLGDLIDRGPGSAEIIGFFLDATPGFARFHFLMGNHEEMLLRLIDAPTETGLAHFLRYGGRETFESYGASERLLDFPERHPLQALPNLVPGAHRHFLRSMDDRLRFGDYLFVHAGIRPDVPIDEQVSADLRWIRGAFLDSELDHGVTVVHGHTISERPEFKANRIGIDTGAYASGTLTALGLEGTGRWLIATGA